MSDGFGGEDCAPTPIDIPVEERIAHEKYDPLDANQYHDIALLRLSRTVSYSGILKLILSIIIRIINFPFLYSPKRSF